MADIYKLADRGALAQELLRESNHRIANQLFLLVAMIHSQAVAVKKGPALLARDDASSMLAEMAARVIALAHLHRRLVDVPQAHEIDLPNLLIESCTELSKALALGERLRFRHALDSKCPVSAEQASVLSLLVGEIVMNAVKYAHPTGIPVEVTVACSVTRDGRSCVEISDDGVGLPEGFDERHNGGVGFKIIRSLAEKVGAELTTHSDDLGLSFSILLPSRETPAMNVIDFHPPSPVRGIG